MITKKQIGSYLLFIALVLWAVFSTYKSLESSERVKSLEASHKILEKDFLNEQENIQQEFENLTEEIKATKEKNFELMFQIEELKKSKADRKSKKNEKDTDIAGIRNADSLYREISRHYQR